MLRTKYNPDGSDLRKAQLRMLELLQFLDKICIENNLSYWLDGGTLLGAIRHGGFIPWDDDTDVCMPYEDAIKLKRILGDIPNDGIVLQTSDSDPNYTNCAWMTIRDLKSRYIQQSILHNRLKYQGLQVDIFIMENRVPRSIKQIAKSLHSAFVYSPLIKNGTMAVLRPLVNFNNAILNKFLFPCFRKIKGRNDAYTYGIGNPFPQYFPSDVIFPVKRISFEGIDFNCPADPKEYLKIEYGDWSKLPSEKDIQTHNAKFEFYN